MTSYTNFNNFKEVQYINLRLVGPNFLLIFSSDPHNDSITRLSTSGFFLLAWFMPQKIFAFYDIDIEITGKFKFDVVKVTLK
jgi:hypothetical protein